MHHTILNLVEIIANTPGSLKIYSIHFLQQLNPSVYTRLAKEGKNIPHVCMEVLASPLASDCPEYKTHKVQTWHQATGILNWVRPHRNLIDVFEFPLDTGVALQRPTEDVTSQNIIKFTHRNYIIYSENMGFVDSQ